MSKLHLQGPLEGGSAAVAVLRLAELDVGKQSFNVGVQPSSQRGRRR